MCTYKHLPTLFTQQMVTNVYHRIPLILIIIVMIIKDCCSLRTELSWPSFHNVNYNRFFYDIVLREADVRLSPVICFMLILQKVAHDYAFPSIMQQFCMKYSPIFMAFSILKPLVPIYQFLLECFGGQNMTFFKILTHQMRQQHLKVYIRKGLLHEEWYV